MYTVFTKENGLELWIISLELYHFSTREIQRIVDLEQHKMKSSAFIFLSIILSFTVQKYIFQYFCS